MFTAKESIYVSNRSKSACHKWFLTNLSISISNKFISDKSKANSRQILDALIRTQ